MKGKEKKNGKEVGKLRERKGDTSKQIK